MSSSFQVRKIGYETPPESALWERIRPIVESTEDLYPGIDVWLRRKVKPGLADGSRLCYTIAEGDEPKAIAIIKRGVNSKLCTFRVAPDATRRHLGSSLMLLVASEIIRTSKQAHFTIPESIWSEYSGFYESFGFEAKGLAEESYRRGDRELFCSAGRQDILNACRARIYAISQPEIPHEPELARTQNPDDRLARLNAMIEYADEHPSSSSPGLPQGGLLTWHIFLSGMAASLRRPTLASTPTEDDDWTQMPALKARFCSQEISIEIKNQLSDPDSVIQQNLLSSLPDILEAANKWKSLSSVAPGNQLADNLP